MKPKSVVFSFDDFPSYLGYGVLDPVSYTISGEKAFADYHYQGLSSNRRRVPVSKSYTAIRP